MDHDSRPANHRNRPQKEKGSMELITTLIAISIRLALPLALLFWASIRLQTWDKRRTQQTL